jgi:1,2-diacylglycerol-3-alpha-glucose alpha-1,2-glucosyltransferase
LKVKFLVTPVGLMMGNIESAKRLANALVRQGLEVTDDLGDKRYDILHVHTPVPPSNITVVKRAKRMGIPVVLHAHTTAEDAEGTWTGSTALSGLTGRYLTHFYNLGDMVLAPSAWTKERLQARGVVVPIQVLSNGVDLERFRLQQERRERFRSRYGIPSESVVAYSIGVVCVKKGIESFPLVARALPDLGFVWVGRRSMLYHPLKVRRAMKKCSDNVRFIHDVEDIVDAHCGCDIFFTPSLAENQGMAVMEAMAVGRPVVARNLQAYDGLLTNGESAIVCSSTEEFVSALDRVRRDKGLAHALAEKGRATIGAHDLKKVAAELITIYSSLLEEAGKKNEVSM